MEGRTIDVPLMIQRMNPRVEAVTLSVGCSLGSSLLPFPFTNSPNITTMPLPTNGDVDEKVQHLRSRGE